MNRRKLILSGFVLLLIIVNTLILWKRTRQATESVPTNETSQVNQVVNWASHSTISFEPSTTDLKQVVSNFNRGDCEGSRDVHSISLDELSAIEREDLYNAIAALLQCYAKPSATALLKYMDARHEHFNPVLMERLKSEKMSQGLISKASLSTMSDQDFFAKAWNWQKCNSHWYSVVDGVGCIFLWRCHSIDENGKLIAGSAMRRLFQNSTSFAHLFQPEFSFADACRQPKGVLVADVCFVIQHDENLKKERSPYYLRFWLSEHDGIWHPLSLIHVTTNYTLSGPSFDVLF